MKWKRQEYKVLLKRDGEVKGETVKGNVTDIDGGYRIGIHKNENGAWIVTDVGTGGRIGVKCYEDRLKDFKEYVEHHELDIRHTLDKGYADIERIEELKKYLE